MENYNRLLDYQNKIYTLEYTINILTWTLKTDTAKDSKNDLIRLITDYENKLFKLRTSKEYATLLKNTINSKYFENIKDEEKRYIIKQYNNYEKQKRIPTDFYNEYIELKNKTNIIWQEAKVNNNYELFKPHLKKMIDMTKEYYKYISPNADNIYDVMLDTYERGTNQKILDKLFDELKEFLIPFIKEVSNNKNKSFDIKYTKEELIDIGNILLDYIGFDTNKGILSIFPHGFMSRIGANDIRIAFKHSNDPIEFVTTIIHEGGHGIFEQNIMPTISRYENTDVDLYALHESQSRFYENILGRNKNFWIPIYNKIKDKLKIDLTLDEFSERLNNVQESLIRTEADEVTYPLHIIIRYELEKDIFNNKISVDDLPAKWNELMKKYLNIDVKNYSEGLLQDIHWSDGDFGYFPSYLLGTIYDGMLIDIIENNIGNIDELLRNGKIKDITNYLIDNIYKYGGAYTFNEILKRLNSGELSVKPLIKYYKKKYKDN